MKISFINYWAGNSFKDGEAFPIHFFGLYVDLHPSCKYFELRLLNFGVEISFAKRPDYFGLKAKWIDESEKELKK